jgi:acyl carrier protein
VLGTSPSKVDVDKPLISLGLDSLMAVEIGNRMQSELGVSIPPVKFMEGLTTAGMAQYLVEQLTGDRAASAAQAEPPPAKLADLAAFQAQHAAETNGADGHAAGTSPPADQAVLEPARVAAAGTNGHGAAEAETERVMTAVGSLTDHEVDSLLKRLSEEEAVTSEGEEDL